MMGKVHFYKLPVKKKQKCQEEKNPADLKHFHRKLPFHQTTSPGERGVVGNPWAGVCKAGRRT